MGKLLILDACIRGEHSRTLGVAEPVIGRLKEKYEVEWLKLTDLGLRPIDFEQFSERGRRIPEETAALARKVAGADRIAVLAPFWDMSFPSVLKVFIEHMSIPGFTFEDTPTGETRGICKAEKLMYITTRGMDIEDFSPLDQGSSYLKALCVLWGIDEMYVVSACGMDTRSEETALMRLERAKEKGLRLCEEF